MWKQKIGISVFNNYETETPEVVKMLAKIGFDAISPEWKEGVDLFPIVKAAKDAGMQVQSLHAPFHNAKNMWSEDIAESKPALEELLASLEDCKKFDIPVLVVHNWIGFDYTFGETKYGFENFSCLVDKATEYGVKIAFENTEGEEYLFALMDFFKENETVGFCWDSGHELCYNYSKPLLEYFGDRLYMTHLNDNLGISDFDGKIYYTDDLHLLPYDGVADWDRNVNLLKKSRKLETLNFELKIKSQKNRCDNEIYEKMGLMHYFIEAYKRACRIVYNYSKEK